MTWGFLAVFAAVYRKWGYLALAAPIGFPFDFMVPFVGALGVGRFELISFVIALGGLWTALWVTRELRRGLFTAPTVPPAPGPLPP